MLIEPVVLVVLLVDPLEERYPKDPPRVIGPSRPSNASRGISYAVAPPLDHKTLTTVPLDASSVCDLSMSSEEVELQAQTPNNRSALTMKWPDAAEKPRAVEMAGGGGMASEDGATGVDCAGGALTGGGGAGAGGALTGEGGAGAGGALNGGGGTGAGGEAMSAACANAEAAMPKMIAAGPKTVLHARVRDRIESTLMGSPSAWRTGQARREYVIRSLRSSNIHALGTRAALSWRLMKARTPRSACWPDLIVMAALACAACGSTKADNAPTEKQGEDPSAASLPASIFLLDDFEELPTPLPGNNSVGEWYGFDDGSVQDGNPTKQFLEDGPVPAHPTLYVNRPSTHALHARGGPYDVWGSGFAHPITAQKKFDASAFAGLLLWAKKGASDASGLLTLSVPTAYDTSTMVGGRCVDRANASIGGCGDAFHIDLALTDDWRVYKIAFSELHQAGFGFVPPHGFDKTTIFDVNFMNLQGTTFNEWIDDVALYSDLATTTGAGGTGGAGGAQNDASMGSDTSTGKGGGSAIDSGSDAAICKKTGAVAITGQDIFMCKAGLAEAGADGDAGGAGCFACLCVKCPKEAMTCIGDPNCKVITDCCRNACNCRSATP